MESISPEPAEWFARKQGHISGFLRGHTGGSVLPHGKMDVACLHRWPVRFASAFLQEWGSFAIIEFRHWCCFPQKQNEAFLLSEKLGGDVQPVVDETRYPNILMNALWDSGGSHSSLTWSSVSISPGKVPSGNKYLCVIDLSFHMHRSQNNAANTAILSPGLCKWDWAELLFPACPFSADPWRFPKKVPQSSSTFCCSSDIQLLSVFSLRRVSGIFQALSDNHVVLLIQKSSTPCSRGVNSGPRKLLQDWKEK